MIDIIHKLMEHYGVWPILNGIWSIICLVIKSIFSRTDILTEYKRVCDAQTEYMNECMKQYIPLHLNTDIITSQTSSGDE